MQRSTEGFRPDKSPHTSDAGALRIILAIAYRHLCY